MNEQTDAFASICNDFFKTIQNFLHADKNVVQ